MNDQSDSKSEDELPADYEERIRGASCHKNAASSLARSATTFLLVAGGVVAVGAVLVPTRTAGASRSARLEWQRRATEIAAVVDAPTPAETSAKAGVTTVVAPSTPASTQP